MKDETGMKEKSMSTLQAQPKPDIPVTGKQRALITLSWIGFAISMIGTLVALHYLPATVPTHFNGDGQPNGYGSAMTLLVLPGITLLLNLLFAGIGRIPPGRYSYRWTPTNPRNAEQQYRQSKAFAITLRLLIVWLLVLLNTFIIYSDFHGQMNPILALVMTLIILAVPIIALIVYAVKAIG